MAKRGIYVEIFSLAWMILEFSVGFVSGIKAHSLLLVAFGLDSLIEIVSGGALLWRLYEQTRRSATELEKIERRASHIVGWCLMALSIYITVTSIYNLVCHSDADGSLSGTLMSLASVICMPILMTYKLRIARQINSAALKEDAMCNLSCAYTAGAVLIGSLLTLAFGWWWADSIFSLLLVIFILKEALEGIRA